MLFELLPYPMHIVITFLTPSKFYITSKNQRPVTSTSGKSGRSEVDAVYANYTIEVQKKITPAGLGHGLQKIMCLLAVRRGIDANARSR